MTAQAKVVVSGGFDDIRSQDIRLLEESSQLGELTVLLYSDEAIEKQLGKPPKFPLAERKYFLNAIRYVSSVIESDVDTDFHSLPKNIHADLWADAPSPANSLRQQFCYQRKISYKIFPAKALAGFPEPPDSEATSNRKKVIATGSFDWFHSGHIRFFEEASSYGDLYIIVGHDANIRLLKGEGHPLLPQDERRYVVGSIKYVKQALISTGHGWLDADPEIQLLKPEIYAVNEDGDKGGKREYCETRGIKYLVLKRIPAPGLPARSSTNLRGF